MSEKRFDMILGKQRARARLRDFIGAHLHARRAARVLCLPGANGREVEHVYRKLGFRDENIVGVESDPSAVSAVRAHYPRIAVHGSTINDFILDYATKPDEAAPPFDVVSLDYCGTYSYEKFIGLRFLAMAGKLADNVIIATNFFAGREQPVQQETLRNTTLMHRLGGAPTEDRQALLQMLQKDYDGTVDALLAQQDSISLKTARDIAPVTAMYNELVHYAPAATLERIHGLQAPDLDRLPESWPVQMRAVYEAKSDNPFVAPRVAGEIAMEEIALFLTKLQPRSDVPLEVAVRATSRKAVDAFFDKYGEAHVPVACEMYSYINDAGHRMVSDFVQARYHRDALNRLNDVVRIDRETGELIVDPQPQDFDQPTYYVKYVTEIAHGYHRIPHLWSQMLEQKKRIDLGGGALPFDSERTKERVIVMLKKGRTDDEILAKFPITVGTLRALRAHITMGNL